MVLDFAVANALTLLRTTKTVELAELLALLAHLALLVSVPVLKKVNFCAIRSALTLSMTRTTAESVERNVPEAPTA